MRRIAGTPPIRKDPVRNATKLDTSSYVVAFMLGNFLVDLNRKYVFFHLCLLPLVSRKLVLLLRCKYISHSILVRTLLDLIELLRRCSEVQITYRSAAHRYLVLHTLHLYCDLQIDSGTPTFIDPTTCSSARTQIKQSTEK